MTHPHAHPYIIYLRGAQLLHLLIPHGIISPRETLTANMIQNSTY